MGLEAYSEQHNALLGAVRAFQDRIQAYKQDFVQREVLVLRGFLQYLLGTLSNELSQHTETHKRKVVEWETRCASAHADKALKRLVEYR